MWQRATENMDKLNPRFIIKFVINQVLICIATVSTPFVGFIWIYCYLYRTFVTIAAKVLRRDLGPRLDNIGTLLAEEDFTENPSNCSIVAVLRINENLTLHQVQNLFHDNVICAKIKDNSSIPRYRQLQQYPVNYRGYPFWMQDDDFSLANHVQEYERDSLMPVSKIHQHMLNGKFPKQRSPWQLTIFRNGQQNWTFLALRLHHCMSDGRSIVKLLVECLGNKQLQANTATFKQYTISDRVNYLKSLPFGLARMNARLIKHQFNIINHPWNCRINDNSSLCVGLSGKIPLFKIQDTARVMGVKASSVIMSAVTSSIGKYLLVKNNYVSESMPVYLTLPKEGHPSTLENHLYISIPEIPQTDDDIQRLRKCDAIYRYMRSSNQTQFLTTLIGIVATLPKRLRCKLAGMRVVTTGLSNIAGDKEGFMVGGSQCLGFNLTVGLPPGAIGVNFTVISYKESIQISVVAKASILVDNEAVTMARLVEKEIIRLIQLILG